MDEPEEKAPKNQTAPEKIVKLDIVKDHPF
jgi:hypothetical protein